MKNNQIATIVVISLVVAVIVSIATASITSNVIKVNQNRFGNYKVYTVDEVDQKLEDVATNDALWERIGNCEIKTADTTDANYYSCKSFCNNNNQQCLFGHVDFQDVKSDNQLEGDLVQSILACNSDFSPYIHPELNIQCTCCS